MHTPPFSVSASSDKLVYAWPRTESATNHLTTAFSRDTIIKCLPGSIRVLVSKPISREYDSSVGTRFREQIWLKLCVFVDLCLEMETKELYYVRMFEQNVCYNEHINER